MTMMTVNLKTGRSELVCSHCLKPFIEENPEFEMRMSGDGNTVRHFHEGCLDKFWNEEDNTKGRK